MNTFVNQQVILELSKTGDIYLGMPANLHAHETLQNGGEYL